MNPLHQLFKPSDLYQASVDKQLIRYSQQQAQVLQEQLDPYYLALRQTLAKTFWQKLRFITEKQQITAPQPGCGVYLWGSVGTGKTMLMELFHQALVATNISVHKVHFNQFMRDVHDQLHRYAGTKDPLKKISQQFAQTYTALCLDEFFVEDIADAMILAQLLSALLQHKITLLITSNIAPDLLYADGLQRQKFIPAIELIQAKLAVIKLSAANDYRTLDYRKVDYRKAYGLTQGSYFCQNNAKQQILAIMSKLAGQTIKKLVPGQLKLNQRQLAYACSLELPNLHTRLIAFDFEVLCGAGRSVRDYLLIASVYKIIVLYGVPQLHPAQEDKARRFIALIDEIYNHGTKLIIEAEADIDQLYQGNRLVQPFARTVSRIKQICAAAYWEDL